MCWFLPDSDHREGVQFFSVQILLLQHTSLKKVSHKTFQKITSKPIFYFMYSNTIYILNNTIIECFDIAFNEAKRKSIILSTFMLQKRKEQPTFQNRSMDRKSSSDSQESYSIVHIWQQNHSLQRMKTKCKEIIRGGDNIVISQSLPDRS